MKIKRIGDLNRTHGMSLTREYFVWKDMLTRCYHENNKHYQNYGGRGIVVCELWKNSFLDFLVDMGKRPSNKHSIDRINVNGNYCFENCRWATKLEQDRNKRNTIYISYEGIPVSSAELCERFNIDRATLRSRLKLGWSIDDALSKPIRRRTITC